MEPARRSVSERAVLVVVGLGGMLVPLNSTMLAVALPRMTEELQATVAQTGWLVTAYLITMASLQPVGGKLGDRYGRRPFLLGGVAAFGIASAGAALSADIWMLIVFRAAQAVSGAIFFPNGAALVREIVPAERRGSHFGLMGSAIGFGAAAGPVLGGVLTQLGGWPAIFWINVPLVGVIFAFGWRVVPPPMRARPRERFDLTGAALLALVLAGGAWLLTNFNELRPAPAAIVGAVIAVAFAAFVRRELGYADPVLQLRFFRRRTFAAATGGVALSNLSMYVLLLAVPLLLAQRPGWPASRIGLVLTSLSAGMVLFAPIGGRAGDRMGRRAPAFLGLALLSAGVVVIAVAGPDVSAGVLVGSLLACGVGLGLSSASLQTSAVESIEAEHAGMAAGANSTARYLGSVVGTSILAGVLSAGDGFQTVLTLTAVTAVGSAVLALGLPKRPSLHIELEGAEIPAP